MQKGKARTQFYDTPLLRGLANPWCPRAAAWSKLFSRSLGDRAIQTTTPAAIWQRACVCPGVRLGELLASLRQHTQQSRPDHHPHRRFRYRSNVRVPTRSGRQAVRKTVLCVRVHLYFRPVERQRSDCVDEPARHGVPLSPIAYDRQCRSCGTGERSRKECDSGDPHCFVPVLKQRAPHRLSANLQQFRPYRGRSHAHGRDHSALVI